VCAGEKTIAVGFDCCAMEMKHKSELWHHRFHTHKNAQNHPYFFGSYLWLKMIDFD
jgi:hypothetical protein